MLPAVSGFILVLFLLSYWDGVSCQNFDMQDGSVILLNAAHAASLLWSHMRWIIINEVKHAVDSMEDESGSS